jgi:hypothetical protein
VDEEVVVVKEISAIKKKPNTLSLCNKKDALKASQELARPHLLEAQGCKIVSSQDFP